MKISMIPNKIVKLIHASKGDTSLRKWTFEPYDNNGAISVSNIKPQLVYKTENGGTEQLLPVNTSTPTTSYFDGTINYGTDTDVEFTYKQSSYTGQARIKSIKGNTLVWNQLCDVANPNAQGSPYTYNSSSHSYTVTFEEGSASTAYVRWTSIPIVAGHKYLVRAKVISATTGWQLRCLPPTSSTGTNLYPGTHADLFGKGEIFEGSADSQRTFSISKNSTFTTAQTVTFIPQVYDLSAKFGVGNEPTVDVFNALYSLDYYAYNSGSLLNFNGTGIKTTGFNQWDEETESGYWATYSGGNGGKGASANYIRCKNMIPVLPNTEYFFIREKGSADNRIGFYDANGNYLGYDLTFSLISGEYTKTFTTPSNAYYMTFYFKVDGLGQACLNISDPSKNGTYEPYTSSTLSLPISTYFPTGMKSAVSVYDELSDKAITRVGSVDLGSLTWTRQSTGVEGKYRFTTSLSPSAKASDTTRGVRSICSHYQLLAQGGTGSTTTTGYTIADYSNPFIYDEQYATATAEQFKTAMSGVYLNYELATYTEQDIQNASLVCKNIEVPCYLSSGNLVCDATEELTNESGFFDAKLKLKDSSSVAYSSKFKLHVEDL